MIPGPRRPGGAAQAPWTVTVLHPSGGQGRPLPSATVSPPAPGPWLEPRCAPSRQELGGNDHTRGDSVAVQRLDTLRPALALQPTDPDAASESRTSLLPVRPGTEPRPNQRTRAHCWVTRTGQKRFAATSAAHLSERPGGRSPRHSLGPLRLRPKTRALPGSAGNSLPLFRRPAAWVQPTRPVHGARFARRDSGSRAAPRLRPHCCFL